MPLGKFAVCLLAIFSIIFIKQAAGFVKGKYFDRIAIFVFENEDSSTTINDPNFANLAKQGVLLSGYSAVTHPSQPNYLAMIAANTFGVISDNTVNLPTSDGNIIDLLEPAGITWKAYMENYPGNCNTNGQVDQYARKHNPFMSFNSINGNATRCANIVDANELKTDIMNDSVPQYVFYTPNLLNDGHNTNTTFAGNYAASLITPLLSNSNFTTNTLVVIVFDEAVFDLGNKIYAVMLGPLVQSLVGTQDNTKYNHYSLVTTVEKNWNLSNLGYNDVSANALNVPSQS